MWRTSLSIFLSAIFGSALASIVYVSSQIETLPSTPEDLRMALAIAVMASLFTVPGALLLATLEFALSDRIGSDLALDGALMILGGLVGATILGFLGSTTEAPLEFALLGAFYGLTTAVIFVFFQRQFGSRRQRQT
jgi:hypothetical protein